MPTAFATLDQLVARHPAELVLLAADETTGLTRLTRVRQRCSMPRPRCAASSGALHAGRSRALDDLRRDPRGLHAMDVALALSH